MNPDLAALLAALRDDPADRVARLALADWCLEQPAPLLQARGQHLHLHAQRAALQYGEPGYHELSVPIRALEKRWRRHWLGQLRPFGHRCDFLPGGLVAVSVSSGKLAQVMVQNLPPPTRDEWAWVTSLRCAAVLTAEQLRWLAAFFPPGFLRSFDASVHRQVGPPAVHILAGCSWLDGLRNLSLGSHLGDEGIQALAGLPQLARLRSLALPSNDLGENGLQALAGSSYLHNLRRLHLQHNRLGPTAVRVLGQAPWSAGLEDLGLWRCFLGPRGLRHLLDCWRPTRLSRLDLGDNGLDAPAGAMLAGWPGLAGVTELLLSNNPLGDQGAAALARSPYLGRLQYLKLGATGLGDEGLRELARSPVLGELEELYLDEPGVTQEGYWLLVHAPGLPALRRVRLPYRAELPAALRAALQKRFPG